MMSPKPLKTGVQRTERVKTRLPANVNGAPATTVDISATGVFIVLDEKQTQGSQVEFWVELETPGGLLKLCCKGEVMRVDDVNGKVGIGVKILSQKLMSST